MRYAKTYDPETIAYAAARGITTDELPLIADGCSGGISAAMMAIAGKTLSCEHCCDIHDVAYAWGGPRAMRREADRLFRQCAAAAGQFPPGLKGKARRAWRITRAWILWAAVRAFGWLYWGRDLPHTAKTAIQNALRRAWLTAGAWLRQQK
jgi:hypothetical protein